MAEIGGNFTLDASGVIAAMQKVDSAIIGVTRRAAGIAGSFAAAGAAIAAVFSVGDRSLRAAAGMEALNAEFQVLLGSAEAATGMLAELTKFADETPFDANQLAANAKTLLAFGAAAESILPTLQQIGDVAGSSKERFDSLTLAFAQMQSAGRLMGQDLLQMVNAGFNPLQEISRTTGRSMAELKKEMEQGSISAQMVADAFRSATSEGGRFFGNLAAQSQTGIGLMSTLSGAIDAVYRSFGAPILDALKPALVEAIAAVQDFAPVAGEMAQNLVAIAGAASSLAGPIASLAPLWVALAARMTGADVALARFFANAGSSAWATAVAGINAATRATQMFGYELGRTGSIAAATRAGVTALGVSGSSAMASLASAARAAGAAIAAAFGPASLVIMGVTAAIQKAFEWFTKLQAATAAQRSAIQSASDEMRGFIERAKELSSSGDKATLLDDIRSAAEANRDNARSAMEEGNYDAADVYWQQASALEQLLTRIYEMPDAVIRANARQQEAIAATTAALEKQADAAKEAADAMKKADEAAESRKAPEVQRANILERFDMDDEAELDRRISRDRAAIEAGTAEDWQIEQLPMLIAGREKLFELEKQISEEAKKQAEAAEDAAEWKQRNDDRAAIATAEASGKEGAADEVRLAQLQRDLIAEAQEIGGMQLEDARKYAETIVAAERSAIEAKREQVRLAEEKRAAEEAAAAAQWREDFQFEMERIAAEVAGDTQQARMIELEQRRAGYIREGMERGGLSEEEATAMADQRVALEAKALDLDASNAERARIDALFADSLTRVGGGGGVAGRGAADPVLKENERQSSLLNNLLTEARQTRELLKKLGVQQPVLT